jgi:ATP-dependent protease Clp ATPase subunit
MTDAMFDLPSEPGVKEFTITREFVENRLEKTNVSKLKAA